MIGKNENAPWSPFGSFRSLTWAFPLGCDLLRHMCRSFSTVAYVGWHVDGLYVPVGILPTAQLGTNLSQHIVPAIFVACLHALGYNIFW